MPVLRWRPLAELEEMFEEIPTRLSSWDLAVDVCEDKDDVIVEMHIPGIVPDKIDIEVEDNYLRVSGVRKEEEETKDKHFYRKEIKRGAFERTVMLPTAVIADQAKADFEHGVLKIILPKKQAKKPSKIKIGKK